MSQSKPIRLKLDEEKLAAILDRWSDISPEEGTEECICMVCAKMIGAHENDPRWENHPDGEYDDGKCLGCSICEFAIRIFNDQGQEMRFHIDCFETILQT